MKGFILALAAAILPATACAHTPTELKGDDEVHSYILLDRTGSMSGIWTEALGSVNAYATGLSDESDGETIDTSITVAVFDAQDGLQFDVLRRKVGSGGWSNITDDEASPRGMTPLYDAIGRIVALAEGDNPEKAVIVIMTDGMENSSREINNEGAKAALDRVRAKGWEVVFLGAEFASFDDAEAVGVSAAQSMAVGKDQLGVSMERLAKKSRDYGAGKEANVEFDAEDRAAAAEEDVKERKGGN